ncbi:MAG: AraC family transcriptional regulator ligand-binding domain-containing protein [Pseudomonadota bacterium]
MNRTNSDISAGFGVFSELATILTAFGLSRGLTIDEMSSAAGLSKLDLVSTSNRLPDSSVADLWRHIEQTDTDGTLALKLAKSAPPSVFAGLAEGARYADTLGDAIDLLVENGIFIADRLNFTLTETKDKVCIDFQHPLDDTATASLNAFGVCLFNRVIRDVLCVRDTVYEAKLRVQKDAETADYESYFEADVQVGQNVNQLVLHKAALNKKISHANTELFSFVKIYNDNIRAELERNTWPKSLQKLRAAIVENALKSDYESYSAARRANLSLRSAQRLAAKEGYSLQGLIDDVRMENAKSLLRNLDLKVSSIAFMLNYSDDRSFRRSFKRIVGLSPSAFRGARMKNSR